MIHYVSENKLKLTKLEISILVRGVQLNNISF